MSVMRWPRLVTKPSPADPSGPSNLAVDVRGLTKRFGVHVAVDSLTFAVPTGVVCGLVGPHGAGKTTTMRTLLGLTPPDEGTVSVLGRPLSDPRGYPPKVGAVLEGSTLDPAQSGRQNLKSMARKARRPTKRVDEVLELVQMSTSADELYRAYPLEGKQRLDLAAALLAKPDLLLLDEPMTGLSEAAKGELQGLLRTLAAFGVTVVASASHLHDLDEVAGHVVVLNEGTIRFEGTVRELVAARRAVLRARPEDPEDLLDLVTRCEEAGLAATMFEGELHVEAKGIDPGWLRGLATTHGIALLSVTTHEPTLEDASFDPIPADGTLE